MKKDPRINAKSMTLKNYAYIFLAMLFFCGSYAGLYFMQIKDSQLHYIILSMLTYILVISAAVCVLFALVRHHVFMKPIHLLSQAAERLAAGDFSVRIPPQRKDGRKDEFEVLFEDFNTMAAELASTEMLKSDFVSTVSHEFKTPLAVIQNYATILQSEELSDAEQKEYCERIGAAASNLSVLVSNILQINRLENQKIKPERKAFNLSEALCRCILNYEALLDEKNIFLDADLDQDLMLCADEALLDMVWNNLIANAVKFTPKDGTIRICLQRTETAIHVTVADTGCGIAPASLPHVFDKFYQADSSHKTKGNGLGLALAKRIVELMGGEISAESEAGKGAVFTVTFRQSAID